ncbi:MAG: hypothetical protein WCJ70_01180 [bacterium]
MHTYKINLKIALVTFVPVLLVYLPFLLHLKHFYFLNLSDSGMQQIYKNWDGPNFVLNAITGYDPIQIAKHTFAPKPYEYYANHFPLYSWWISLLGPVIGYFQSALVVNICSNLIVNVVFYKWVSKYSQHPLWLTFVFTVFPPRYWIVRSVISPEMLLIALVLSTLWKWERGLYVRAALLSFLAVLTKFQAIILAPVFLLTLLVQQLPPITTITCEWRKKFHQKFALSAIVAVIAPIAGYLLIAFFYQYKFGDFYAYFNGQKGVGMGAALPFSMFNSAEKWVGTGWLEHTALYFVGMFTLIGKLWTEIKNQNPKVKSKSSGLEGAPIHPVYLSFVIGYTAMLTLIPQVDIMRLAMPLAPIFIMAFHNFFESKTFHIGLLLSLPALYMYALNFIMTNQAGISDWGLFK